MVAQVMVCASYLQQQLSNNIYIAKEKNSKATLTEAALTGSGPDALHPSPGIKEPSH